jgi:hypothetical protein
VTVQDAILNYNRSVAKGDWKEAVSSLLNAIENETCEIRLGHFRSLLADATMKANPSGWERLGRKLGMVKA